MTIRIILLAALLAAPASAGPLTPPVGPVAPTPGPEPRTPINSTNTPGDADSLFKITQRGSYYLTGNITGVVGKHGIEIAASGVTLDLNGFDLVGVAGSLDGVRSTVLDAFNIAVLNGSVRGWGDEGVDLEISNAINFRVADLFASGNGGNGVSAGTGGTVTNCSASDNNGIGILVGSGCTVTNCSAYLNTARGISTGSGSTVANCSAFDNTGNGISTGDGCTVSNCSVSQNSGSGISTLQAGAVIHCSAYFNTGSGISVAAGSTVTGCSSRENAARGIIALSDCSITDCTIIGNQTAGIEAGPRCAILKTTVGGTFAGPGVSAVSEGLRIEGSSINENSTFGVVVDTVSNIAELAVVNCTIRGNGAAGISSEASTQVLDSVIASNGTGIILTGSCLIRGCTINSNADSGIELLGNANVVANNTLSSNAATVATTAGILVLGTDNTIDGNRLFSNVQGGIKVNLSGNLVLRNYLARTGANITAVAGNAVAQTLAPGAGFVSTDPNANFTY